MAVLANEPRHRELKYDNYFFGLRHSISNGAFHLEGVLKEKNILKEDVSMFHVEFHMSADKSVACNIVL